MLPGSARHGLLPQLSEVGIHRHIVDVEPSVKLRSWRENVELRSTKPWLHPL